MLHVTFPESSVVPPGCVSEPADDESVLTSVTDLDLSEDEMSVDGDSATDGRDSETMRSEVNLIFENIKQLLLPFYLYL